MADDTVSLVFTGFSTQLIRLPTAGDSLGVLTPCGIGWECQMSRGRAEKVVSARPEMFRIDELATDKN